MPNIIDLISTSFSTEKSLTYKLSIREFPNGFSFCVIDTESNKCVAIKYAERIKEDEPYLKLTYKQTILIVDSIFSIVPNALYEEDTAHLFLPMEPHLKRRVKIGVNKIDDKTLIFDTRKFSDIKHEVSCHPLYNLIKLGQTLNKESYCIMELTQNLMYVIVVKDHKLIMANTFDYETKEDAAYYILAIYQQLNFNVEDIPLFICGDVHAETCPMNFLEEYIRNIAIVRPDAIWSEDLDSKYYPYFATQIHGILCE